MCRSPVGVPMAGSLATGATNTRATETPTTGLYVFLSQNLGYRAAVVFCEPIAPVSLSICVPHHCYAGTNLMTFRACSTR